MILGKSRPTAILYVAAAIVIIALVSTFFWARTRKAMVPASVPAPLHANK